MLEKHMLIGPIALLMFVFWQEVASPQESLTKLRVPGSRSGPGLANCEVFLPGLVVLAGEAGPVVAPLAPPAGGEGVLLRAARPGHRGLVRGRLTCGRGWRDNSAAACPPV